MSCLVCCERGSGALCMAQEAVRDLEFDENDVKVLRRNLAS